MFPSPLRRRHARSGEHRLLKKFALQILRYKRRSFFKSPYVLGYHCFVLYAVANSFFRFKQFTVQQDACAMKVCTDACLFGAWCAAELEQDNPTDKTLLDIGTGTGLLSLMVRQKNQVQIDAVEIEEAAAMQAFQNVQASPWRESIHVSKGDVLNMDFSKRYDYIISNPPFYENELQSPNGKRNLAHHSSKLNLAALFDFIAKHLNQNGTFLLLLPYKRRDELKTLGSRNNLCFYKEISVRQTESHAPFRIMLKGGVIKQPLETATITIAGNNQSYTPAFIAWLHDYYLYL